MERFITKKLLKWKKQKNRKPLILRGARQIGKTWSVLNFGKQYFDGKVHLVDLEKHSDWHSLFKKNLDINRILSDLEILLNSRIDINKDLLFIDEIQSCPRALMALRYFYEEYPQFHVIAAGSLLEFAPQEISFPVGRVQFLNMFPLNFAEFLIAMGMKRLSEVIMSPPEKQSEVMHNKLLDELRKYFFVGGMPECVQTFVKTGSIKTVFEIQSELINTFREDFSKYATYADKNCLNQILSSVARNIGNQIKYSRLTENFSNPTIKNGFNLLCQSQLISKILSANPGGIPLGAYAKEKIFKAKLIDIGLMHSLCELQIIREYKKDDLLSIYKGSLAEQFVGQEFQSAGNSQLFYWSRPTKSSTAEVDFLINKKGKIIPVEVKSGSAGRLRSMHLLLEKFQNCPYGYVFSTRNYSELPEQKLVFLPLYYAFQISNSGL